MYLQPVSAELAAGFQASRITSVVISGKRRFVGHLPLQRRRRVSAASDVTGRPKYSRGKFLCPLLSRGKGCQQNPCPQLAEMLPMGMSSHVGVAWVKATNLYAPADCAGRV